MSTIKLNELAESDINLTDLIAKSDNNGLMSKTNIEKLATYIGSISTSGMKAAVESTSPAPTEDGLYPCTESGTYTNFGGEVVDISSQVVFISVSESQTVFTLVEIPLNIVLDSVPTENSTNTVESGGVFEKTTDNIRGYAKQLVSDYNSNLVFVDIITVLSSVPSAPTQNDTYYVYGASSNTIFTGVTASTGQLIIYNNSAWEVHDVIPIRNKNFFLDANKIAFGDFTYSSTTRDDENYIANSITRVYAKKLPDNILFKIGWFRNDTTSVRLRIFYSSDNGVNWIGYSNLDLPVESDGYTVKLEDYSQYQFYIYFDLREIQSLGSFNYYIVPDINDEGNIVFNNEFLKVPEGALKTGYKITSDEDVDKVGGIITGGSDFTQNLTELPIYLDVKGTIRAKIQYNEDIFGSDKGQTVLKWLSQNNSFSTLTLRNLFPRANELWNQRMDSYFYFTDGQSSENFIIRPGAGLVENSTAYTVNQGTLFAVRYIGLTGLSDLDLRVTKNSTTLFFHDGDAGSETNTRASFTLSNYSTVKDLIDAIDADVWCSNNIEILFKNGLSQSIDKLCYVNATKMVSKEVRQIDYTTRPLIQTTPPADPTGSTEWEWVYDAFPVYIEKNAIGNISEVVISWNQKGMECYLDGKRMRLENDGYTPYSEPFFSRIFLNDSSSPFNGKILEFEYTQDFQKPEGLIIPIEAHVLQHDYNETTAAAADLTMSLQRLTDIGTLFKEKGWKCITANELKRYKQEGKNPPYKSWLMVTDDYRTNWFTTKSSRNLMDKLDINVSFNVIGSDSNFISDRDFWQNIHNTYGWDVHTHCKWHTETSFLSYNSFVDWCNDAKTVFDDNFLSNTIITIPFSIQFIRVIKGFQHLGFNVIFTGAVDEYQSLNDIPHFKNNAYIRLLADSNISLDNLKNTLDLFDKYD